MALVSPTMFNTLEGKGGMSVCTGSVFPSRDDSDGICQGVDRPNTGVAVSACGVHFSSQLTCQLEAEVLYTCDRGLVE